MTEQEQKILNELYIAYTKVYWKESGITKLEKKHAELIENYKKRKYLATPSSLTELIYNIRRRASYPCKIYPDFENILDNSNSLVDVENQDNKWLFRFPKNLNRKARTLERFILNANQHPDLINNLDEFCSKHQCFYKTPSANDWSERTDTVVIYSKKKIAPEMEAEIKKIASPHIRTDLPEKTNLLDGRKLADGIFKAKELNHDDIIKLLEGYRKILPEEFVDDIEKNTINKKDPKHWKLSLGQHKSLETFIKNYNELVKQPVNVSDNEIPEANPNNREFKNFYRSFFMREVDNEPGSKLHENLKAANFEAVLKRQNGEELHIIANDKNQMYFGFKDKDKKIQVPQEDDFAKLVRMAQEKGVGISFGDIRTPEYKARLLLAAIKAKPEIKITNPPELTEDFLNSVDPKTKTALTSQKPNVENLIRQQRQTSR